VLPPGASGSGRVVRVAGPVLPYDRTYHLLWRLDKIRRRVLAEEPDIVEAHSPYLAAAAVVSCGRDVAPVRTAFWHSDHVGVYVEPALTRLVGPGAARLGAAPLWQGVRAILAPFDAVFVAGRAQADRLRAAGVRDLVFAPMGVDGDVFRPGPVDPALRAELGGGSSPAALLIGVGRFAREKRWDVVLDAFAKVRASRDAVLVLFGDGPERARLRERAPAGVRFVGFEPDRARLAAAMRCADVLVHGSPYETFGLGVAEAVASGLPVVVPDEGGAAESVDLTCGERYASLDPDACAAAIQSILSRDPGELRARAREAAAKVPTTGQHYARVIETYDALLRERRRAAQRPKPV
jgi:alpha-1,6-mannosyltransferase